MSEKPVSKDDPIITEHYEWAPRRFPDAPIVIDAHGVIRWKATKLATWIVDRAKFNGQHLLNAMHAADLPIDEVMRFYRDIGYSLSGFLDVFGEEIDRLDGVERDDDGNAVKR